MLLDHLRQYRLIRQHQVVGEEDGKGLFAYHRARHRYRMSKTQGIGLAQMDDADVAGHNGPHLFQEGVLALFLEFDLELVGNVEVIGNGPLTAPGDEDHLVATGGNRLFYRILDQGFVDHRQHFLGACLGGGQEASAKPRHRENCLTYAIHASSIGLMNGQSTSCGCCSGSTLSRAVRPLPTPPAMAKRKACCGLISGKGMTRLRGTTQVNPPTP